MKRSLSYMCSQAADAAACLGNQHETLPVVYVQPGGRRCRRRETRTIAGDGPKASIEPPSAHLRVGEKSCWIKRLCGSAAARTIAVHTVLTYNPAQMLRSGLTMHILQIEGMTCDA